MAGSSASATPAQIDDLAGLDVAVLDGVAPSEALRGRLQMLRGSSDEARLAMAEVLLREAPDRQALALLLFALADDGLGVRVARHRLPQTRDAWCKRLIARFGRAATVGLCALARRYPGGRRAAGSTRSRASCTSAGPPFRGVTGTLLRAFAEEQLEDPAARAPAVAVLVKTGASPSLLPRLWQLLRQRGGGAPAPSLRADRGARAVARVGRARRSPGGEPRRARAQQ